MFTSVSGGTKSRNVTDMVDKGLNIRGVQTYRDKDHPAISQTGTDIPKELREGMQDSTISVVMLSKGYLASSWCLEELVRILDCRERMGMVVLPIFYGVDPSDIRKARGIESAVVGRIVVDIVDKRVPTNLISIYPLGYDTCDVYLKLFLQMGLGDVLMVGICGQSKMGKTAIARAVYEQICFTFDGSSFLTTVGEKSKQPNGLVELQEQLLSDILSEGITCIPNSTRGRDMIREKLSFKRVLIVLDDVDDLEQLLALVGNRYWFGSGSKIIITTRHLKLLKVLGVDQVFMAQGLPLSPNMQDSSVYQSLRKGGGLDLTMGT
ncbi:hypothetical protein RJ640_024125 [Escallonia rubra]|uniref:TIR domain-containing protein n=1 Tax=Escallonia rubra TaxID=112253 RepID=A0AA88TY81_9ASTE|nr:hypothetical protein RJ640_024125 [Escallonia rubra]